VPNVPQPGPTVSRQIRGFGRPAAMVWLAASVLTASVLAACVPAGSASPGAGKVAVVTSSTVFGDLIANVGGDRVAVTSLVPRGADVHTFEPRPADLRAVSSARLIVMNGLGLDDWLRETVQNAAPAGTPVVELARDVPGVELLPGEEPGARNPHLWMSVPNAIEYVARIGAALASLDPASAAAYSAGADAYEARLRALDESVRERIDAIPAEDRRLVTFHDAFPYFAREYGLEVVGVAVKAPGQEPSAAEVAALVEAIRASGVKAIFSEDQFPTDLVDRIAAETGATVVAALYDDSLGDPPITSYEAIIEWDVERVVEALT
jgi:ABC-type Zn uptake system ZnuABC Zn-binding protein ZnuA